MFNKNNAYDSSGVSNPKRLLTRPRIALLAVVVALIIITVFVMSSRGRPLGSLTGTPLSTYKNDRFSIQYPTDLKIQSDDSNTTFSSNSSDPSVVMSVKVLAWSNDLTIGDIHKLFANNDGNNIKVQDVKISGLSSYIVNITASHLLQCYIADNSGTLWMIQINSKSDTSIANIAINICKSFKVNNNG